MALLFRCAALLLQLVSLSLCAVQRSQPEHGVGGYLADTLYEYRYESEAAVYHGNNITMQAKVSG